MELNKHSLLALPFKELSECLLTWPAKVWVALFNFGLKMDSCNGCMLTGCQSTVHSVKYIQLSCLEHI